MWRGLAQDSKPAVRKLLKRPVFTLVPVLSFAIAIGANATLFAVRPDGSATYAGVTFILAASALLAAWLPAARATRVDPMVALRHD